MNGPYELDLMNVSVKIDFHEMDDCGVFQYETMQIKLSDDLSAAAIPAVLFHEIAHFFYYMTHGKKKNLSEEAVCDLFGMFAGYASDILDVLDLILEDKELSDGS
jgi:hypothetical protein